MPEAWLTHTTIMWVLIVLSVWTFCPFVLVNVLARLQTSPPSCTTPRGWTAPRPCGSSSHVTLPQLRNVLLSSAVLRGIWMFTKFDVPWLLGFGGGAGEAIRTLPVFTTSALSRTTRRAMGAALSNVMLALLLMTVTIYFVAIPAIRRTPPMRRRDGRRRQGGRMGAAHRPVRLLRVPALLDGGVVVQG
jgi:ABC-type sugar transport system permease subunit